MIIVKVVTSNNRGFLKNLFEYSYENIVFSYEKKTIYEVSGKIKKVLSKIIKWKVFDYLGIFRIVKMKNVVENVCFSYNRFLCINRPYVILLENPSALVNYCWERPKHFIAKKKLRKFFNDKNLYAIVCMSKTCYEFLGNLYNLPKSLNVVQNYPLILDDKTYTVDNIKEKTHNTTIECLFISSDFQLKGGRDIIEVFKKLEKIKLSIHLSMITKISTINKYDLLEIHKMKNISLHEFNLNREELNEYYKKSSILLNPTRGDSFSLVTLEAIKYGCAVIATDIYAIKEMVREDYNGYIKNSMYQVWDEDGTANKYYRTHQKKTVCSRTIDTELVFWMRKKIFDLNQNRSKLEELCCNSLKLARETEFSEEQIAKKWENLLLNASRRNT